MKKKRGGISAGVIFIAVGAAVVAVCMFPSKWMIVFISVLLIVAGILLLKC